MRSLLQAVDRKIQNFRQSFYDKRLIRQAQELIQHYGFRPRAVLGKGKDAIVFKAEKEGAAFVVKVLSPYAKSFLPITKDFLVNCRTDEVLDVQIQDDQILFYSYRNLSSP